MISKAPKAYNNREFLNSRDARTVRILCEYLEPEKRLQDHEVTNTVVFFGSARTEPASHDRHNTGRYYLAAEELAFRLAEWSNGISQKDHRFHICTGGGPGIMEAANRGANRAGAQTIGYNISLPFEQFPNNYITPALNFEFHYFFMRKLWFLYHAKALIVFPGGMGTMDELFEVLTLKQTKKLEKSNIPILLYDREFWEKFINFDMLVDYGFISPEDLKLFRYFSTPEEGFTYLKKRLEKLIDDINDMIDDD
ncbi:MAG: LOG family protein [Spirochaetes bacterium]|nr:LOG family protein [Spirochaetota bacterium]